MENKSVWDDFWTRKALSEERLANDIKRELISVRWRKIERLVLGQFGSFTNLEVIEIGSGVGTAAMIMALRGATVTLLDNSRQALLAADELFKKMDLKATTMLVDALELPADLKNSFDISMSFGLAEHFAGPRRKAIIDSHLELIKPGGISLISVPNARCLPYLIYKKMAEVTGLWSIGFEQPFTRKELIQIAGEVGFEKAALFGSSFIHDFNYFLIRSVKRIVINGVKRRPLNTEIDDKVKREIPSYLDDYFGYALVLAGFARPGK